MQATGGLALAAAGLPVRAEPALDTARVLVGFAAGGTTDVLARRLSERLRTDYAKAVVVDNRAGAGGRLAIEQLKTVPADGRSMVVTPASMLTIYPHIYAKLSYNPFADLTPVAIVSGFAFGLGVGPAVPESVRNVRDFIAWCKANPGKANYGSPAAGSSPHFIGALLEQQGGVPLQHVVFRGSQPAILDMMGGQVSAVSGPLGEFLPHLKSGKVRMLATSGAERSRFMPQVPTYTEQGFRALETTEWFGVFLPAKARPEVVQALSAALKAAAASSEFREGIEQMGLEATYAPPAELARALKADHDRWAPVVKSIGFSADS